MSLLKSLWIFLNSNISLLILGFVFTTVIGGLFVDRMQQRNWERQVAIEQQRQDFEWERSKKFELFRVKLKEGQDSLEEISDLINLRFFRLQKVFESLAAGDLPSAEKNWSEYASTVERWNTKLIIYQNKLERLVDKETAKEFNNYETDNSEINKPKSLHGRFYVTHKKVRAILECMKRTGCLVSSEKKNDAANSLRELDFASDAFVDKVSQLFLQKTFELEEFRNISPANPSLQPTAKGGG